MKSYTLILLKIVVALFIPPVVIYLTDRVLLGQLPIWQDFIIVMASLMVILSSLVLIGKDVGESYANLQHQRKQAKLRKDHWEAYHPVATQERWERMLP